MKPPSRTFSGGARLIRQPSATARRSQSTTPLSDVKNTIHLGVQVKNQTLSTSALPSKAASKLPIAHPPTTIQKRSTTDRESLVSSASASSSSNGRENDQGRALKRAKVGGPPPVGAVSTVRRDSAVGSGINTKAKRNLSSSSATPGSHGRVVAAEKVKRPRIGGAAQHPAKPSALVKKGTTLRTTLRKLSVYAGDESIELPANSVLTKVDDASDTTMVIPYPSPDRSHRIQLKPSFHPGPLEKDAKWMLSEYMVDIYAHLRVREQAGMVSPHYMNRHPALDWSMRSLLLSWLSQVASAFSAHPSTLFLAASLIDRFLAIKPNIPVERLQLVGITALFIACKVEQVTSPTIHDFIYMIDGTHSPLDLLKAEKFMLATLTFDVSVPTSLAFHDRVWAGACRGDDKVRIMTMYLLESSLLDERFLAFPASLTASAVIFFSIKVIYNVEWNEEFEFYSGGYTPLDLFPCCNLLLDMLYKSALNPTSVYDKYSTPAHLQAAPFLTHFVRNVVGYVPDVELGLNLTS